MAAELGSTEDPKELVPGNPETVNGAADQLTAKANTMKTVADDLGNVRVDGWEGKASNAFWDGFSGEKPNWMRGHDSMTAAAKTLTSHASTLTWAQGQATEAIALWKEGEAATKKAKAEFDADPANAGTPAPGGTVKPAFNDPGEAKRAEAREMLSEARRQLKEAGSTNGKAIENEGGKGPGAPSWLSGPAAFVDKAGAGKTNIGKTFKEHTLLNEAEKDSKTGDKFGKYKEFGDKFEDKKGPDVKVALGEWSKEANLFKVDAKGATQLGDVTIAGSAEAKVGAEVGASGSIGRDGISGEVKASAGATASAQGSAIYGPAEVGGSAKAFAGAEAQASGSVGPDGVKAGASAFAGARAEGEVHADVGGVGAGVKGEAWAGVGAEANVQAGFEDGKFKIGGEAGVGLGIGGKIGGEITIDPGKIADTVGDAAGAVGDAVGDAASAINPFD
ncbi:putative T7SS-secreted protein [Amycolatopsis nigrescens]|uniref:putative T7SS-secreted protein n=1 Tax=Amycolatopsis nigrescens TaxID=381445 RepID=UPI000361A1AA|nr:hypothetical protein [Amycolatopsis nigrescens]